MLVVRLGAANRRIRPQSTVGLGAQVAGRRASRICSDVPRASRPADQSSRSPPLAGEERNLSCYDGELARRRNIRAAENRGRDEMLASFSAARFLVSLLA